MKMKLCFTNIKRYVALGALFLMLAGAATDVASQRDRGLNQPGRTGNRGGVDPGVNQPGAAGNVGRDPGVNQPGRVG